MAKEFEGFGWCSISGCGVYTGSGLGMRKLG